MTKIWIIAVIIVLQPFYVLATTYYLSPSGSDSYTTVQAQSSSTPWKSFSKAFGEMSAGDTLILRDGTYSEAAGTGVINTGGSYSAQPPNGTNKSTMTTIQAENDWQAVLDGTGSYSDIAIRLGKTNGPIGQYVKIDGLRTHANNGKLSLFYANYCYITNCAINGPGQIGTIDHEYRSTYNLIEDTWFWAEGQRLQVQNYRADYNVYRRIVIRPDDQASDPISSFTVYNGQYNKLLNVIIIDKTIQPGEGDGGDFSTAQHSNEWGSVALRNNRWLGCMSINSVDTAFHWEGESCTSPSHYLKNSVAVSSNISQKTLVSIGPSSQQATNGTIIENVGVYYTGGTPKWGIYRGSSEVSPESYNVIMRSSVAISEYGGQGGYGYTGCGTNSHLNIWALSFGNSRYSDCTPGTGEVTTDPFSNGISYPTRTESGSNLSGTGKDGGDYGPTILYGYGRTGAFYDDTGVEALQDGTGGESIYQLWPWVNEDTIRSHMRVAYGTITTEQAERGFCADGETLTTYIWEYLGNQIPNDIYGLSLNQTQGMGGSMGIRISGN